MCFGIGIEMCHCNKFSLKEKTASRRDALNKKKFEDIDCASEDKKVSLDIKNEDVPRLRIGKDNFG